MELKDFLFEPDIEAFTGILANEKTGQSIVKSFIYREIFHINQRGVIT